MTSRKNSQRSKVCWKQKKTASESPLENVRLNTLKITTAQMRVMQRKTVQLCSMSVACEITINVCLTRFISVVKYHIFFIRNKAQRVWSDCLNARFVISSSLLVILSMFFIKCSYTYVTYFIVAIIFHFRFDWMSFTCGASITNQIIYFGVAITAVFNLWTRFGYCQLLRLKLS